MKYSKEKTLINKIKKDLKKQIKNNYCNKCQKTIKEYKNLILNININSEEYSEIYFNFSFSNIEKAIKKEFKKPIDFKCINIKNIIFYKEVNFSNMTFNSKLDFSYSMFNNSVNFINTIFNNDIDFSYSMFSNNETNFKNIIFKSKTNFSDSIFNCTFSIENTQFYNEVIFTRARFEKEVLFDSTIFNKRLYFAFSQFKNSINVTQSIFHNILDFSNSQFDGNVIFDNINIVKNNNNINKVKIIEINFNSIKFSNNKCFLSLINYEKAYKILLHSITLRNIIINGKIELKNIQVKKADFKGSIIDGGYINPVNFKVHKFANRESALFLKQQAYAANNAIDALQYKAQEVELHKDELIKKSNKTYKDWADILSIGLSSLYSDNGQNWVKALFMTIFITAFCFTIFYIPDLTKANIIRLYYKNLFPELIKYFIPTDYSLIIAYAASKLNLFLKTFGVLVYFLGKVLFWYGSVQTVQAFRKFSKGA